MPEWKKNIFVRVVNRRMQDEGKTAEGYADVIVSE